MFNVQMKKEIINFLSINSAFRIEIELSVEIEFLCLLDNSEFLFSGAGWLFSSEKQEEHHGSINV